MDLRLWVKNKFSVGDSSLDNLLRNVFWMMRFLTINLDSTSQYSASVPLYLLDVSCLVSYLYCYVFSVAYNWGWLYPEHGDTTSLVIIISLSFASNISTMKLAYMFLLRKKLMEIIDAYRSLQTLVTPSSRYAETLLARLKAVKKRALVFWCSFVGFSTVYLCLPLVCPGRNLPENSLQLYGLEPMFELPNYYVAYILNMLAGATATFVPSNVTALLIVLVGYIEAHIAALITEFEYLWKDIESEQINNQLKDPDATERSYRNKTKILNVRVKKQLIALVKRHAEIVVLRQRINALFEGVIGFEFALTMIALCAVLLGGLQNTYLQIPYTIIQLVVDSLIGQKLLDAGELFNQSVYKCGWEHFDASNMKTVQVVLQCAQRPTQLTAGGVTPLSYESFMSVTRSVYSAYATLSKTMGDL